MVRTAKKEIALTVEEKLTQALVPAAEQPYQVPENWRWTRVGMLSSLHRGVSYKKDDAHPIKQENDCLVMRGGNIGEGYIDVDADNVYVDFSLVNKDQLVKKNDIIIVASTGSTKVIGRAGISFDDYADVAFGAFLMAVRPSEKAIPRYMDFFFQSDLYRNRIRDLASGVNINNIRSDYITESPYPLPPLAEQQRIVDRIESLFAKLDEAKEKAQAVVDGFEDRKAAILHKAFTGELTKQWRESQGLSFSSWDALSFGELTKDVRLGLVRGKVEQATDKQYGYLKMNNITMDGFVDLDGLVRVDATVDEVSIYSLCPGDFLFNTRNSFELVGKNAVWQLSEVKDMLFNNNIMRVRFHDEVLPQFVCYYFNSAEGKRDLEKVKKNTTNIAAIYAKDLNKIRIPLPSKEEQEQICLIISSIIDSLLAAREAAEQVIDQIDTMKKAILARAFRGELGTNDPDDESAEELLKRVL